MKIKIHSVILSIIFTVTTISVTGCASSSTSAIKINQDNTYSITVADEIVAAKNTAYEKAAVECDKQNRQALMLSEGVVPKRYSVYEFTFKCVDK